MKRGEAFSTRKSFAEAIVEYQHFLELHRQPPACRLRPISLSGKPSSDGKIRLTAIGSHPESHYCILKNCGRTTNSKYEAQGSSVSPDCHVGSRRRICLLDNFTYRRSSYLAAAHRFRHDHEGLSDKTVAPEALYYLALTYQELGANGGRWKLLLPQPKISGIVMWRGSGRRLLAKLEKKFAAGGHRGQKKLKLHRAHHLTLRSRPPVPSTFAAPAVPELKRRRVLPCPSPSSHAGSEPGADLSLTRLTPPSQMQCFEEGGR